MATVAKVASLEPGLASVAFAWIALALLIVNQRACALRLDRMQTAIQEIRAANEKLKHALTMKRIFMTTMTHGTKPLQRSHSSWLNPPSELRTPMQGIISLIEDLKESLHEANANTTSTVSVIAGRVESATLRSPC